MTSPIPPWGMRQNVPLHHELKGDILGQALGLAGIGNGHGDWLTVRSENSICSFPLPTKQWAT